MNDNVKKMLYELELKDDNDIVNHELNILSILAKNNSIAVYEEIYKLIISDYNKNPTASGYGSMYFAAVSLRLHCSTKIDKYNNITYKNNIDSLINHYNHLKGKRIFYYGNINSELYGVYFDALTLEELFKEDGFKVILIYPNKLYVSIDTDKFRQLIMDTKLKMYTKTK